MPHPTPNGIEWHRSALGKTSEFPKHFVSKITKKACKTPLAKHTENAYEVNIYNSGLLSRIALSVLSLSPALIYSQILFSQLGDRAKIAAIGGSNAGR